MAAETVAVSAACAAGRRLLQLCEESGIDPTGATLIEKPKYIGTRGIADINDMIWCFVWSKMFDYEACGLSSKKKLTCIFIDGHVEWNWRGILHRDEGPAVTTMSGEKRYFKMGKETDAEGQPLPEKT